MESDEELEPPHHIANIDPKPTIERPLSTPTTPTPTSPSLSQNKQQNGLTHKSEHKQDTTTEHIEIIETLNLIKLSGMDQFKKLVLKIMRETSCYSLMPVSGQVVIFDAELPVKHAFRALSENDIKCAPVWSANVDQNGGFCGFMTVTDFADILNHYAQDLEHFSQNIKKLENDTVGFWCNFRKKHNKTKISRAFVYCEPDEPIFNVIFKMHQHFIHRMPIKHTNSILCIYNHGTVLRHVFHKMLSNKIHTPKLNIKVSDLECKSNDEHITLKSNQKVLDAIKILAAHHKISAIPICDDDTGKVKNAFLRSDIRFFARNQAYMNLHVTIESFLANHRTTDYVPICTMESELLPVLSEMLTKRSHAALIVDADRKFLNILNFYIVFQYIIGDEQMKFQPQIHEKKTKSHLKPNV